MRLLLLCVVLVLVTMAEGCGSSGGCRKVDCIWSQWSDWSACSVKCGNGGSHTRTRTVQRWDKCGGSKCGPPSETTACSQPCQRGTPADGHCSECPFPYEGDCCLKKRENNCLNRFILNQPWRSTRHKEPSKKPCDSEELMDYWYQFTSLAGNKMPVKCVRAGRCGVDLPMWMDGVHPSVDDGIVTRRICVSRSNDSETQCCEEFSSIKVRNCGDYFIYSLPKLKSCGYGFCAGEQIPCPKGTRFETGYTPYTPYCNGISEEPKEMKSYSQLFANYVNLPSLLIFKKYIGLRLYSEMDSDDY